jgi:hypothetical protein
MGVVMRRLFNRSGRGLRRLRFAANLRHLHGPRRPDIVPGEVVLIALVRNGAYYLDAFFQHYRAMGAKHFVFIDNGSTDATIERIRAEPGTIIDQCRLPLARYEDLIRQYPAQTYGRNRWCLYVDMDEIFDFEGRAQIGIHGLIRYLEQHRYTAFVAQMIEMFPKQPLSEVADLPYDKVLESFRYFDLSAVDKYPYHASEIPFSALLQDNTLADPGVSFCFGGIRQKVFGEHCCLTKHPLVFNGEGVTPAPHPHLSMGVHCADVTGVIKHYKFANDPLARDAASIASGDLAHGEDRKRAEVLGTRPELSLFSLDARRWNRVELLYRGGFLTNSQSYTDFVQSEAT